MNRYQKEYIHRINKVRLHIDDNLDQDLNLRELSSVANFSPYHFHRIFSAFTGESLIAYVTRIRLEKAATLLLMEDDSTISEISEKCGYNNLSVFCRSFKKRFGVSAEEFRIGKKNIYSRNGQQNSKNNKTESKKSESASTSIDYVYRTELLTQNVSIMKKEIEIKEMPELNLVYTSHVGNFDKIGNAYEKLMRWAGPRGLLNSPDLKTVTVYHDNPEVTEISKLRQSACITVEGEVRTEGEFGNLRVPGGKYVVGRFEITDREFEDAWNTVCVWLSESGYQPSDGLPYELYHNDHMEHPEKKFILDICMPVKPL